MMDELKSLSAGDVDNASYELKQLHAAVSGLVERTTVDGDPTIAVPEEADQVVQEATLHRSG